MPTKAEKETSEDKKATSTASEEKTKGAVEQTDEQKQTAKEQKEDVQKGIDENTKAETKEQEKLPPVEQTEEGKEHDESNTMSGTDHPEQPTKQAPKENVAPVNKTAAAVAEAAPKKQKQTAIRGIVDHTCHIGGSEYSFKKGEELDVPHHVATILQNGGKALIKG